MEDSIINLLASENYIVVNRSLIKELGLKEAIILGELASEYNYYKKNDLLDEEGYFYSTIENVQENTSLSSYEQKKCLDNLLERNIITVILKGIPAKRHIKINSINLINLFANNLETSFQKIKKLDSKKLETKNNNINNNNKNNNISSSLIDNNIDIYSYLQQNGFVLNPIHYEVISKWEDSDLTRYAIQKAVLNGKYNINYIDKIIYNWEKQNIKTLEQAKALDDEYEKAKEFKEKQKNEKRMTSGERMNQYFDELEEEERRKNGDKSS